MTWLAISLFVAVGIALIAARRPVAQMEAMVAGGRMAPGCVVAQGIAFFILALLVVLLREG